MIVDRAQTLCIMRDCVQYEVFSTDNVQILKDTLKRATAHDLTLIHCL